MPVQLFVIDRPRENFFVIKKVNLLLVAHRNIGVPVQEIMQRGRPRFLCARNNEIEAFDCVTPGLEHRGNDIRNGL